MMLCLAGHLKRMSLLLHACAVILNYRQNCKCLEFVFLYVLYKDTQLPWRMLNAGYNRGQAHLWPCSMQQCFFTMLNELLCNIRRLLGQLRLTDSNEWPQNCLHRWKCTENNLSIPKGKDVNITIGPSRTTQICQLQLQCNVQMVH